MHCVALCLCPGTMHNVEPMWHYVETIWHYVETHNTFGWVATFPAECGWLEPTRHISFAPIIRWSRSWESDSQSRNRNIANANSKAQLGLQELNTNFRFVWRAGKQTSKQASRQASKQAGRQGASKRDQERDVVGATHWGLDAWRGNSSSVWMRPLIANLQLNPDDCGRLARSNIRIHSKGRWDRSLYHFQSTSRLCLELQTVLFDILVGLNLSATFLFIPAILRLMLTLFLNHRNHKKIVKALPSPFSVLTKPLLKSFIRYSKWFRTIVVIVGSRFTANIDSLHSASTLFSKAKLNNQSEAYLHKFKMGLGSQGP